MPNINLKGKKVIVGGGIAGISAALTLAQAGYRVVLFEKNVIGSGASGINPGRMGHGFHYTDQATAKKYLHESIATQRAFPGYLVGQNLPWEHPLRHGRYFITKDSNPPAPVVLETYRAIQEEYRRLVHEDPRNEVFGPPDKFFRILDRTEYEHHTNLDLIEVGVETCEHLFRINAFLDDFKRSLRHENIEIHEYAEVLSFSRTSAHEQDTTLPPFTLTISRAGQIESYQTDTIINSTWYNIQALNSGLEIPYNDGERTNRLKAILIVKLNDEIKDLPSMFFCMGQHCMFSNLGNGTGMITYAPITNMEVSSGLTVTETMRYYLEDQVTHEQRLQIGERMLEGTRRYIPALKDASVMEVRFGIVQTKGDLKNLSDLKNPEHPFNKRSDDGIRVDQIKEGIVITNPAMKLFYFLHNGEKVLKLVQAHEQIRMGLTDCPYTNSPQIGPQYSGTESVTQFTLPPYSPLHSSLGTSDAETTRRRVICTSSLPALGTSPGEEDDFSPFVTEDESEARWQQSEPESEPHKPQQGEELEQRSGSESDRQRQQKQGKTSRQQRSCSSDQESTLLLGSMFNRERRAQRRLPKGKNVPPHMSLSS